MLLPDVNVLIYSFVEESTPDHLEYARFLDNLAKGSEPFALSVLVLTGFIRIVTNRRIFKPPIALDVALAFVSDLAELPSSRVVGPGPNHLVILDRLCRSTGATGKLVADAQHAAVAMEHGCTMVSADRDFARFPELKWRHPLEVVTTQNGDSL